MRLYAKCFEDQEEFMDVIYKMAKRASSKKKPKNRKKR